MRAFEVKKGTVGDVYTPERQRKRNFVVTKDQMFDREEMIFDPISYANKTMGKASRFCYAMAKKGFAGFKRNGYLLVVKYSDVTVY